MIADVSAVQLGRIAWMAGHGCTADEIASDRNICLDAGKVRFLVDRLGLPPLPSQDSPAELRIKLPRLLVNDLDEAATNRNIGRAEMAEKILATVLSEGLVTAVMDDGVRDG